MNRRVLVVGPHHNLIGGVSNFIKLLLKHAKSLYKLSFDIVFFECGKRLDNDPKIKTLINYIFDTIHYFNIIKKHNIELVHLNPSIKAVSMWRDGLYLRIAKRNKVKVLFFIHGWDNTYFEKAVKRGFFKRFHFKTLYMADAIVVLSPEFKDKLVRLGIEKDKIHVLTTMVEVNKYIPTQKDFSPPHRLLFCSRLVKEKGIYETIEAMKYIVKKYPNPELWVMGYGKEYNNVKEYVKKNGLEKNVKFLGSITGHRKYETYKKAHVFVFPSYSEGFSTVIIEAMSAGLPIITTPVGGLKYALKEGINGYFINSMPPRPKEIANKVIYLLENKDVLYEISSNNIKDALEKYDVSVVLKKIIQIYNEISSR